MLPGKIIASSVIGNLDHFLFVVRPEIHNLREQGAGGCLVHLVPNLLVAGMGDALVTLRADPLDEQLTLVRIQGYGRRGESPSLRQARQRQLQLWWGPYAEQLQTAIQ